MPTNAVIQYPLEYAQPDLLNPGRRSNPNFFSLLFPFVPSLPFPRLVAAATYELSRSSLLDVVQKKSAQKAGEGDDHITVTETGAVHVHGTRRCWYNCRVRAKERTIKRARTHAGDESRVRIVLVVCFFCRVDSSYIVACWSYCRTGDDPRACANNTLHAGTLLSQFSATICRHQEQEG